MIPQSDWWIGYFLAWSPWSILWMFRRQGPPLTAFVFLFLQGARTPVRFNPAAVPPPCKNAERGCCVTVMGTRRYRSAFGHKPLAEWDVSLILVVPNCCLVTHTHHKWAAEGEWNHIFLSHATNEWGIRGGGGRHTNDTQNFPRSWTGHRPENWSTIIEWHLECFWAIFFLKFTKNFWRAPLRLVLCIESVSLTWRSTVSKMYIAKLAL